MINDWYDAASSIALWEAADFSHMGRDWQADPESGAEWLSLLTRVLLELSPEGLEHQLTGPETDVWRPGKMSRELQEHSARLQDRRDTSLTMEITNQLSDIQTLAPEQWKTASLDQREQAMKTAVNELSVHYHLPIDFRIGNLQPGTLGECQPLGDAFKVSVAGELLALDHPRDAVRTVVHELRHVQQHEMVQVGRWTGLDPYEVDVVTTQRWMKEFAAYSTDAHVYKNLGVEADAERFAVGVTDALYQT